MSNILDTIIATKHEEIATRKQTTPVEALREQIAQAEPTRGFASALQAAAAANKPGVIAEIQINARAPNGREAAVVFEGEGARELHNPGFGELDVSLGEAAHDPVVHNLPSEGLIFVGGELGHRLAPPRTWLRLFSGGV